MRADTSTSHLRKEALPAPPGDQQPFPQKGHKLLLGEFPALQLVGAFAVHATEQVGLPGFCKQQIWRVSYNLTCIFMTLLFPLQSSWKLGFEAPYTHTEVNRFLEKAAFKKRL